MTREELDAISARYDTSDGLLAMLRMPELERAEFVRRDVLMLLDEMRRLRGDDLNPKERIIRRCADAFGLDPADLKSPSKKLRVFKARIAAMFLLRTYLGLSLTAIGELFDRDHVTVMNACDRTQELMKKDGHFRDRLEELFKDFPPLSIFDRSPGANQ